MAAIGDDPVIAALAVSWPELVDDAPPSRDAIAARLATLATPWRVAAPRPGERYEDAIADGRIPTRDDSWHDAFNVWAFASFPRAKAALHARMRAMPAPGASGGRRTREADALTLLDETALVLAGSPAAIEALAPARESLAELDRVVRAHRIVVRCLGHALFEHRRLARPPIGAGVVPLAVTRAPEPAAVDIALAEAIAAGRFSSPDFAPTVPWPHARVDAWLLSSPG